MRILKILDRKEKQTHQISLCGKLEAIVGHYDLAGVGLYDIETLYYDPNVGMYDVISKSKDKIVAYFLENETVAIVRKDMLSKLKADTEEYNIQFCPVESFEEEFLTKEELEPYLDCVNGINWVDDDFMNDESIEFDFDAFEKIDSGEIYLNPKHFSVNQLVAVLNS